MRVTVIIIIVVRKEKTKCKYDRMAHYNNIITLYYVARRIAGHNIINIYIRVRVYTNIDDNKKNESGKDIS